MPKEEIDNTRVVWLDTSNDDEHISYNPLMRRQIEAKTMRKILREHP
jgi:hypothetical protein